MPESQLSTFAEAVNAALAHALDEYDEVLVFGEDVAEPGGVFGVTKGLKRRFGDRVFDTPISESAILGAAVGAAMLGMRPVPEIMWADFALVALDQIVNQAANVRYVTRGQLIAPITIRMQQGSAPGACAQHSQSLEALFAHVPGLTVAMPATPQDAYDVLLAAIACDDPTIVIENRTLYHGTRHEVSYSTKVPPIGTCRVRREGADVTVVTWGAIQSRVLDAAASAQQRGIRAEVIDLLWLRPSDLDAVVASVNRTGRLVVVHEAHTFGGFGAEIVSTIVESGVRLDAPPIRVGTPAARIPAAVTLAEALIPNQARILEALLRVTEMPPTLSAAERAGA